MARTIQGIEYAPRKYCYATSYMYRPVPMLITLVIILFEVLVIYLSGNNIRHGTYSVLDVGAVGMLVYSIFAVLAYLPLVIITNR
jgi:hypothetical protein